MDALPFIKEMLSQPALRVFLSDNVPIDVVHMDDLFRYCMTTNLEKGTATEYQILGLVKCLRLKSRKVGIMMRELDIVRPSCRRQSCRSKRENLGARWKRTVDSILVSMVKYKYLKQTEAEGELDHKNIDTIINSLDDIKRIEDLLPDKADSSNCLTNKEKSRALLLVTAFPDLRELKEPSKMLRFLLEISRELNNLPELICEACEGHPLALLLIGCHLSLKSRTYDTWKEVKDDLVNIKQSDSDSDGSDNGATKDPAWHIFTYCIYDLPSLLQSCFLYVACYPINYEIPARSLTEIWIADGFVTPEKGETTEETANKYLEQLLQRSLVCVSKRSFLGTIKCCRIRQSIHEFAIKQSCKEEFLVANPGWAKLESMSRVAFYSDDQKKHSEVQNNVSKMDSHLAFDYDRNVLGITKNLRVLELRKSAVPETPLSIMTYLRYLGLRGSNIYELPKDIGNMTVLQTLDVRYTKIETLPKSLWNIKHLRHVYVNPKPQIIGPPSTANISDLQILKTVTVHESWLKNFPQCLIKLRKLALLNRDNPYENSNPYWKSISILLSHMVNLLSMTIIGDILPSEFVDTRAFPNLETVKSIKLEGEWNCRKLFIDYINFPSNIAKLTLTKSGLKEDPMPTLEKLQALKYLSLQDGAYTGNKMVCSANGFPQLQLLELKKMQILENLDVKTMAMSQLATLCVVECPNLNKPRNLEHVTIEVDNPRS